MIAVYGAGIWGLRAAPGPFWSSWRGPISTPPRQTSIFHSCVINLTFISLHHRHLEAAGFASVLTSPLQGAPSRVRGGEMPCKAPHPPTPPCSRVVPPPLPLGTHSIPHPRDPDPAPAAPCTLTGGQIRVRHRCCSTAAKFRACRWVGRSELETGTPTASSSSSSSAR